MTPDEMNKLKALAEASYKGPWQAVGENGAIHMGEGLDKWQAIAPNTWTARYIAAANPTTVLQLIAEIERLRALSPLPASSGPSEISDLLTEAESALRTVVASGEATDFQISTFNELKRHIDGPSSGPEQPAAQERKCSECGYLRPRLHLHICGGQYGHARVLARNIPIDRLGDSFDQETAYYYRQFLIAEDAACHTPAPAAKEVNHD